MNPPPAMLVRDARAMRLEIERAIDRTIDDFVAAPSVYSLPAVETEMALILYRAASRLGFHDFGAPVLLLRALADAEEEIRLLCKTPEPVGALDLAPTEPESRHSPMVPKFCACAECEAYRARADIGGEG